jgi:hypothetical protein
MVTESAKLVTIAVKRNPAYSESEAIHYGIRTIGKKVHGESTAQPEINYDEFDKQSEMKAGELS